MKGICEVRVEFAGRNGGGAGLLVPLPPNTTQQRFHSIELPRHSRARILMDEDQLQKAVFLDGVEGSGAVTYRFSLAAGAEAETEVSASRNRFMSTPSELADAYEALAVDRLAPEDRVMRIAEHVAERFDYVGVRPDGEFPALSCDILTGNCLSINAVFLALLSMAGVRTAYHVGYFFEEGQSHADGMHCWVRTLTAAGYQSWDIGHHLKRNLGPVQPGENPVPGARFTLSLGRNLRFAVNSAEVVSKFFVFPMWVGDNGLAENAEAEASFVCPTSSKARVTAMSGR